LEGVEAATLLDVEGEDEEVRGHAHGEGELDEQPGGERAPAEESQVDQRRRVPAPGVGEQEGGGQPEGQPCPQWPAVFPALYQG
jgi:hypothetical protein